MQCIRFNYFLWWWWSAVMPIFITVRYLHGPGNVVAAVVRRKRCGILHFKWPLCMYLLCISVQMLTDIKSSAGMKYLQNLAMSPLNEGVMTLKFDCATVWLHWWATKADHVMMPLYDWANCAFHHHLNFLISHYTYYCKLHGCLIATIILLFEIVFLRNGYFER